jgi:hypothetical protein
LSLLFDHVMAPEQAWAARPGNRRRRGFQAAVASSSIEREVWRRDGGVRVRQT